MISWEELVKQLVEKHNEEVTKLIKEQHDQYKTADVTYSIMTLLDKAGIEPIDVSYAYGNIEVRREDLPRIRKATNRRIKLSYTYAISATKLRSVCKLEDTSIYITFDKPYIEKGGRCKIVEKVQETKRYEYVCEAKGAK